MTDFETVKGFLQGNMSYRRGQYVMPVAFPRLVHQ